MGHTDPPFLNEKTPTSYLIALWSAILTLFIIIFLRKFQTFELICLLVSLSVVLPKVNPQVNLAEKRTIPGHVKISCEPQWQKVYMKGKCVAWKFFCLVIIPSYDSCFFIEIKQKIIPMKKMYDMDEIFIQW